MFGRDKIARLVVEFLGTMVLASAVLAMTIRTSFPYFPAMAAGLVLSVMVLAIGPISGAHINPAVTIGQWSLRKITTLMAALYIVAQMLGGFVAWQLNEYFYDSALRNVANKHWDWRILLAEAIGTFVFTFGIAAVVKRGYTDLTAAFGVGMSLTIGILVASSGSNGVLNPAVALGIQSWSWAYVLGPILGSILGMNLHTLLTEPSPIKTVVKKRPTKKKK